MRGEIEQAAIDVENAYQPWALFCCADDPVMHSATSPVITAQARNLST